MRAYSGCMRAFGGKNGYVGNVVDNYERMEKGRPSSSVLFGFETIPKKWRYIIKKIRGNT